jgi:hypothetical protein
MSEFCTGTATSTRYKLFNVIVYSGNGRRGVNIGFIRPQKDCSWYRFDGEVITPATASEVFETAFCGFQLSPEGFFMPAITSLEERQQEDIRSAASIYVERNWSGANSNCSRGTSKRRWNDTPLVFEPNNLTSLQNANTKRAASILSSLREARQITQQHIKEPSKETSSAASLASIEQTLNSSSITSPPQSHPMRSPASLYDTSRPWVSFATQLVYLREDCIDSLFAPISTADIHPEARQALEARLHGLAPVVTYSS